MKKLRKVDQPARKKLRKEAEETLQRQMTMLLDHPMECCACQAEFKRTKHTVNTWQVTTREDRVHLTCPACWQTITEAMENLNAV
jgi:hypothetical protein